MCDPGGGCEREVDYDARGPAGSVGEGARHDGCESCVASVAAGVDRCAGAALRLLPERNDDSGCGEAYELQRSKYLGREAVLDARISSDGLLFTPASANPRTPPNVRELVEECGAGWTLPEFMADELVACREGYRYEENDNAIFNVFNRRSGAIAAAIALTLEAPEAIDQ